MKGLLKSALGAFVELDEDAPATPTQAVPQPAPQRAAAPTQTAPANYAPLNTGLNQEMVDALTAISIKRPTAYTAFVVASKKLEAILPDENTRIKAAFVTVSGEGRTVEQMLQSIDIHVMDVNAEVDKFNRLSDANVKTEVDDVNAKAQGLLKENDQIAAQITALQNQIATLSTRSQENTSTAATLSQQAVDSAAKIASVKEQFQRAAEYVKQNMTDRKAMLSALIVK